MLSEEEQNQKYEWDHQAILAQKYDEGAAQAKVTIAKEMLLRGIDRKTISQITGLSEDCF